MLDAAQRKAVVKNLRKYERKFAHEDKQKDLARIREATTEKRATRKALRDLIKLRSQNYVAGVLRACACATASTRTRTTSTSSRRGPRERRAHGGGVAH